jgi:serine/threonine protein kinase
MPETAANPSLREQRFRALQLHLIANPEFYEPIETYNPKPHYLHKARAVLPPAWRLNQGAIWTQAMGPQLELALQGWKIHISATQESAERTLEKAVPVCVSFNASFKFASDSFIFSLMNSKAWNRGGSGKFMTIYPQNTSQFMALIEALSQALQGEEGPYILSDKRYKESKVVFYRYGGIRALLQTDYKGMSRPVLLTPNFEEVPDVRAPYFDSPSWAPDPFPTESKPASRMLNNRYQVSSALAFSNTGGVYLATDSTTGQEVVIKEARPHTGEDGNGNDAVKLLHKEYRILTKLAKSGFTAKPIELFKEWEHTFLVQEYLRGSPLSKYVASRNPLLKVYPATQELDEWFSQIKGLVANIAQALKYLHQQGITFGDVSPNNVLFDPQTLEVHLIDFEGAYEMGLDTAVQMFTPGFATATRFERKEPRVEDDLYAFGALLMSILMPMTAMSGINPGALHTFALELVRTAGIPQDYASLIVGLTHPQEEKRTPLAQVLRVVQSPDLQIQHQKFSPELPKVAQIRTLVDGIASYIVQVANTSRSDRLFPSAPLMTNPLSPDYGALGVLSALKRITKELPPELMDWVLARDFGAYQPGLYGGRVLLGCCRSLDIQKKP